MTSAIIAATFYLAWRFLGHEKHTLSWALAAVCATGQWLTYLAEPLFPNSGIFWLTVSAFAVGVITLGIRGHCQRTSCTVLPNKLWPITTAVYLGIVAATVIWPHVGVATAIAPLFATFALAMSARIVLKFREEPLAAEWAAAGALMIVGVLQLTAAFVALQQGRAGDPLYQQLFMHFSFLVLPGGLAAIAMSTVFLLASDFSLAMKSLAVQDQLTGLLNRRGFGERGAEAYRTATRDNAPIAVIVADIDRFKDINDGFGHAVGDLAISHFADVLKTEQRASDFAARLGGEEYALVLPGTDLPRAVRVAERLRERIAEATMQTDDGELRITASFGVAALTAADTCLSDVIVRADRAVYQSKREGRNRVSRDSSKLMFVGDTFRAANV